MRIDTVVPNDFFWKILGACHKSEIPSIKEPLARRTIIALDPGETTGVAVWKKGRIFLSQLETKDIGQAYDILEQHIGPCLPDHLRVEEYRIYNWMADQHSWSVLHTPQLIGAIKVMAHKNHIPISFKLAQQAKKFWTDEKLQASNLYSAGMKHARDAERHLLLYLAFPDQAD